MMSGRGDAAQEGRPLMRVTRLVARPARDQLLGRLRRRGRAGRRHRPGGRRRPDPDGGRGPRGRGDRADARALRPPRRGRGAARGDRRAAAGPSRRRRVASPRLTGTGGAAFGFDVSAPPADRLLRDGDVVEAGDLQLQVLHTPGHTPGGICLFAAGGEAAAAAPLLGRHAVRRQRGPHRLPGRRRSRALALDRREARAASRGDGRASRARSRHDDRPRAPTQPVLSEGVSGSIAPAERAGSVTAVTWVASSHKDHITPHCAQKLGSSRARVLEYERIVKVGSLVAHAMARYLLVLEPCVRVRRFSRSA